MSGHAYTAVSPRAGRPSRGDLRPGAAGALRIAGLCLLTLALVWVLAELVPAGQVRDAILLRHFTLLGGPHVDAPAEGLIELQKNYGSSGFRVGRFMACARQRRGRDRALRSGSRSPS